MRAPGVWWRIVAGSAVLALAGGLVVARAQSGPPPPGAVGMGSGPATSNADPVVAEVEGRNIHLAEVGDEIRTMPGGARNSLEVLYPIVLRRLIEREALVIRALGENLSSDPAVARHMREASNRVLEDAYLHLATGRMVTEQALSARYDAEIRGKPGPEEVHGQAILVATKAAAQDVIAKLAAGADFATLARQSSKDAAAANGGDLGFVRRDALGPEVGAVLFSLGPGAVTAHPVRTQVGWFVLRAVEQRPGPTPTFAEVRGRLEAEIQRENLPAVVQAAMAAVAIRAFDMTGH